jgi:DNA-binding beta-propeller fold protein YncE
MPVTVPDGAITTIADGQYADTKFSSDGSLLYVVSGHTVSVIDVSSGTVAAQYNVGTALGGFDLSPMVTISRSSRLISAAPERSIGST